MVPENIQYLFPPTPTEGFLICIPHPSGNSNLAQYFSLKTVSFATPLPLRISTDPLWGRYGYFLELH